MSNDVFESISQRVDGEETPQNRRISQVANELCRGCELYETQLRDGESNVNRLDIEQRVAELYAKENCMWLPMDKVFDLGIPDPSGNENDTYVKDNIIYKVNNLLNSGSILCLLINCFGITSCSTTHLIHFMVSQVLRVAPLCLYFNKGW